MFIHKFIDMKNSITALTFIVLALFFSCAKPGPGGEAEIHINAKHHDALIPNTVVYIKYDANDFPGDDLSLYDASITTDAMAHGHFKDLKKGNYYIYGVGFDSAINQALTGGMKVRISKKDEMTEVDLQITEGD